METMDLNKLSKKELRALASGRDVWQVRDRMSKMLSEIEGVVCTANLKENKENNGDSAIGILTSHMLSSYSLDLEYNNKEGTRDKITIKQTGDAPLAIGIEVNHVALLAKLINRAIKEINEEGYFINKKLIKKLDKVLYFAREYLKGYSEACSSGGESKWVDDVVVELEWTPNTNLRVLGMLKAAKKMEKALEGVKEHLVIKPFEEATIDGKSMMNVTFGRLSDDIDLVTLDADIGLLANIILNPISIYLKEECPDLPEKDRRRILQSRVAVLALIQIKPPETEAFVAVSNAVLAVMMA